MARTQTEVHPTLRLGRVTVADLPEVHARTLPGGITIEPIRPILVCPRCGEESSATPGDYWQHAPDHVFRCRCSPRRPLLRLMRKRTIFYDWYDAGKAELIDRALETE